jgi:hypothetical protein
VFEQAQPWSESETKGLTYSLMYNELFDLDDQKSLYSFYNLFTNLKAVNLVRHKRGYL